MHSVTLSNTFLPDATVKVHHAQCSCCCLCQATTAGPHALLFNISQQPVYQYMDFCTWMTALTLLLAFCSGAPPMVPTMVKLPGQSRSMIQLLPPPADLHNPLTAVDIARSAEVNTCLSLFCLKLSVITCAVTIYLSYSYLVCLAAQAITALFQAMYKLSAPVHTPPRTHVCCTVCYLAIRASLTHTF